MCLNTRENPSNSHKRNQKIVLFSATQIRLIKLIGGMEMFPIIISDPITLSALIENCNNLPYVKKLIDRSFFGSAAERDGKIDSKTNKS